MFQNNAQSLQSLRAEIDAALAPLAAKHGIALKAGSCTYRPGAFRYALEGSVINAEGEDLRVLNSLPEFLRPHFKDGTTFRWAGHHFKLCGYSPRSQKFPLLGTRLPDGKIFKLPMRAVREWVPDAYSYLL